MSDRSLEKEKHAEETDATIKAAIAAERQRCINRVLTYAALRDQAAIDLGRIALCPAFGGARPSLIDKDG